MEVYTTPDSLKIQVLHRVFSPALGSFTQTSWGRAQNPELGIFRSCSQG